MLFLLLGSALCLTVLGCKGFLGQAMVVSLYLTDKICLFKICICFPDLEIILKASLKLWVQSHAPFA